MERNSEINKKEADIFGLLFLVYGSTISMCPFLDIMASGENIPVDVFEIFDCQGHLADVN